MERKIYKHLVISLIISASLFVLNECRAESVKIGISGGFSDISFDWGDPWKDEYVIRAGIYFPVTSRMLVGGLIGYNNWVPTLSVVGVSWDVRESAKLFDILYTMRFYTIAQERIPVDLFFQMGLGIVIINDAEVYSTIVIPNPPPATKVEMLGDENRVMLLLGGGLEIEISDFMSFEIFPSYNFIFHEHKYRSDEDLKYYSVSCGINFIH